MTRVKQLAKFLTQNGVDLHLVDLKAACPPLKEEQGSKAASQISDQSTETLQAAIAALQSLGLPESTTRPFQEIVDSKKAADAVQLDQWEDAGADHRPEARGGHAPGRGQVRS